MQSGVQQCSQSAIGSEEEEDFHIDSNVRLEGAHPLCGAFKPAKV